MSGVDMEISRCITTTTRSDSVTFQPSNVMITSANINVKRCIDTHGHIKRDCGNGKRRAVVCLFRLYQISNKEDENCNLGNMDLFFMIK